MRNTQPRTALGRLVWFCGVALIGSAAGCASPKTIHREVNDFINCMECTDAQFSRIQGFGEKALASLVQIIVAPRSDAEIDQAKNRLRERYRRLVSFSSEKYSDLAWSTQEEYVDYYIGSLDTRRLRAAYAILLICQAKNRCHRIRLMSNDLPAFAKELVTKKNQEVFLRMVAQYPRYEKVDSQDCNKSRCLAK